MELLLGLAAELSVIRLLDVQRLLEVLKLAFQTTFYWLIFNIRYR